MSKKTAVKKAPVAAKKAAPAGKKPSAPKLNKPKVIVPSKGLTVLSDKAAAKHVASKSPAPKPAKTAQANTTTFVLEDNVPVPPKIRPDAGQSMYPFASMEVGKSFFVAAGVDTSKYTDETEAKKAQMEKCHTLSNRLTGAVRRFTKKNDGFKFTIRIVNDEKQGYGVRVWREEDSK